MMSTGKAFHYTRDEVCERTIQDVRTLNQYPDDAFKGILQVIFGFLRDPAQGAQLLENLEDFCDDHNVRLDTAKSTVRTMLVFFKGALKAHLTPQYVEEDLASFGIEADKSSLVARAWKANMVVFSRSIAAQTLTANRVLDMEWRFGLSAGSSELRKSGHTFLQLKLVLDKGNTTEDVYMEMSVVQFYEFLKEMQIAKQCMDMLN